MIAEIRFEVGDRVVADNNPGTAYDDIRGKAGVVRTLNRYMIGIDFDDGTGGIFSRGMHVLRPESFDLEDIEIDRYTFF